MAWQIFPYSYTSPYIHLWIFDSLWVIIFWVRVTHKKLNVNSSTWITHPTPPLHDPPYHTPAWHTPPPTWHTHPTSTWPTPPHPYMTHPITPLHDPPHPCMTHPTPCMTHPTSTWPNPPHPTPPLVHFWAQRSLFPWAASLCLHPTPPLHDTPHPTPPHSFMTHLSWLDKFSPIHTHPLTSICEFWKPYELLFFELESLVKCLMWIV